MANGLKYSHPAGAEIMSEYQKHIKFDGRLLMIGFGSIGTGVLPMILRHIDLDPARISIIAADDDNAAIAAKYGIEFAVNPLTRENYRQMLSTRLGPGDFCLNLSVDVSSLALIEFCHSVGALYLDTCIEPWPGGYTDPNLSVSDKSNYGLREMAHKLKDLPGRRPTACITHGANPGLVSHFVKQALLDIAADTDVVVKRPASRAEWASLAHKLGVKVIHIAERDTQISLTPKRKDEFVNTWSIDGFISEGCQPAELGWGTHEKQMPTDGSAHDFGPKCAIYLNRPGASTRVRTWTPLEGPFLGYLITHGESISIADYLTDFDNGQPVYRPTVHYAYHPCDAAILSLHEFAGKNYTQQSTQRLIVEEVVSGIDELGVLLCGHDRNAYWYGSRLSIDEARALCPHNNATSLQVTAPILGAMVWALENPNEGVVDPDEIAFDRVLDIAMPYLGPVVGVYGDWTPLDGREKLFPEDIDRTDPWQFKNIIVK